MERLLPAIRCPVLLLQADPAAGAAMTDEEVQRALPLLRQPAHVKFTGLSHLLNIDDPPPALRVIENFLRQAEDPGKSDCTASITASGASA